MPSQSQTQSHEGRISALQQQEHLLQHTPHHSSISDVLSTPLFDYTLLEKVGQGSFGVVRRARRKSTGEDVAIKQLVRVFVSLCLCVCVSVCLRPFSPRSCLQCLRA